jgi:hypothetical protein
MAGRRLRLRRQLADPREVEEARFERNGKVSLVRRRPAA